MSNITGVIISLDAENTIEKAIDSLSFCDKIIVVDGGSKDNTIDIIKKKNCLLFERKFDNFKNQREFALSKVNSEWVIFLDADEVLEDILIEEIKREIKKNEVDGLFLNRISYFLGKLIYHGGWYPDYSLRVFKKGKVRVSDNIVHEKVLVYGKTKRIKKGKIIHYTDPDLFHYLKKLNLYTELSAKELFEKGKRVSIFDLTLRPFYFFIRMYFLKLGFLDGLQGFILAVCSAFHTFIKYAKLWNLRNKLR
ncbi:MAG: glycosyltransferase family 2 protein [candidate division WOR-3 bacterium]